LNSLFQVALYLPSEQVDTSAIDAAAMMGGSGIEPYEALIPGGKEVRAVFKAHRLLYHSTLGLRAIKKKRKKGRRYVSTKQVAVELICNFGIIVLSVYVVCLVIYDSG